MHSYSLGVALFDYLPVLATACGLALLAGAMAKKLPALATAAWTGAVLVPIGGACKASWKLIVALYQTPLPWLENMLFIALAPGFVLLSWVLRQLRLSGQSPAQVMSSPARALPWVAFPLLVSLALCIALPQSRAWFFWLLAVTTVANASLVVQAIQASRGLGLGWPPVAALVLNFTATLALSGLSRLPPGEATAWLQEGVNLSAQLALAFAFWRLSRRLGSNPSTGTAS